MKKILLLFVVMLSMGMSLTIAGNGNGSGKLPFTVKPTNIGGELSQPSKAPILIPAVYLDGHTLSFDAAIEGCEVRLLDEDENVIFSDFIAISQTSLTLPATLSGTFELQIIRGNFIFYCEIEL